MGTAGSGTAGVRIYHNPSCSKSRETLALLRARGVEPEVVLYLKTRLTAADIVGLLELLGLEPRQLLRRREAVYRVLALDNPDLDRDTLIATMVEHPALIERPIVVTGRGARIGRPPERVLEILPES